MTNLWQSLFRRPPTSQDIAVQLKAIERDQKKKRRELELLEQEKAEKIKAAVEAKKKGKQELLRDIFREMRQMEINNGYLNTDLRRLSLAKTALTSFQRKMEMLERRKDRKSLQNLIVRFQGSRLQTAIDKAEVDDDTFNEMLAEILGEEEEAVRGGRVREDVGFADFDRAIAEMAKVEGSEPKEEDFSRLQAEIDRAIKAEKGSEREPR